DAHTHLMFGGNRAAEFVQRLNGATYQEIAVAGGGIASTMNATRNGSDAELKSGMASRLQRCFQLGITAVEVKSGYGLSVEHELRLLRLMNAVRLKSPVAVKLTCLALHAASPEHGSLSEYVEACSK